MTRDEIKSLRIVVESYLPFEQIHFANLSGDDGAEHIFQHLSVLQDYLNACSNHSKTKETK